MQYSKYDYTNDFDERIKAEIGDECIIVKYHKGIDCQFLYRIIDIDPTGNITWDKGYRIETFSVPVGSYL